MARELFVVGSMAFCSHDGGWSLNHGAILVQIQRHNQFMQIILYFILLKVLETLLGLFKNMSGKNLSFWGWRFGQLWIGLCNVHVMQI